MSWFIRQQKVHELILDGNVALATFHSVKSKAKVQEGQLQNSLQIRLFGIFDGYDENR